MCCAVQPSNIQILSLNRRGIPSLYDSKCFPVKSGSLYLIQNMKCFHSQCLCVFSYYKSQPVCGMVWGSHNFIYKENPPGNIRNYFPSGTSFLHPAIAVDCHTLTSIIHHQKCLLSTVVLPWNLIPWKKLILITENWIF